MAHGTYQHLPTVVISYLTPPGHRHFVMNSSGPTLFAAACKALPVLRSPEWQQRRLPVTRDTILEVSQMCSSQAWLVRVGRLEDYERDTVGKR